jgi:hypothetical protein
MEIVLHVELIQLLVLVANYSYFVHSLHFSHFVPQSEHTSLNKLTENSSNVPGGHEHVLSS